MFARAARKAGVAARDVAARRRARPASRRSRSCRARPSSVGLTSGAIAIGAIGTVAYADGPSVWLFGHALDGAGPPLAVPAGRLHPHGHRQPGRRARAVDLQARLARQRRRDGHERRAPTPSRAGSARCPRATRCKVFAKDLDTGRARSLDTPSPTRATSGARRARRSSPSPAAAAVAEAASTVLGGAPARQTGEMCVTVTLRELKTPIRVCKHYAVDGSGPNALAGALSDDVGDGRRVPRELPVRRAAPDRRRGRHARAPRAAPGLDRRRDAARAASSAAARSRCKLRAAAHADRACASRARSASAIPADTAPGTRTIKLTGTDAESRQQPRRRLGPQHPLRGGPGGGADARVRRGHPRRRSRRSSATTASTRVDRRRRHRGAPRLRTCGSAATPAWS